MPRTPWHALFAQMLVELGSRAFDVQTEVELLRRPARADVVLLRRRRGAASNRARILRRLWAWIDDAALVEFKSRADPIARGDLAWWLAQSLMLAGIRRAQGDDGVLKAALFVTGRTPTLFGECAAFGCVLEDEGGGYLKLEGAPLEAKVIVLDEVCASEREPLLGLFSGATLDEPAVQRWFYEHAGRVIDQMGAKVTQTHKEFIDAFIASLPPEQRLAGLDAEQRLAGLDAEQRLAGLDAEQRLAGLDAEQRLAGLGPEEIAAALRSLPPATRRVVVRRLESTSATSDKRRPSTSTRRKRKR